MVIDKSKLVVLIDSREKRSSKLKNYLSGHNIRFKVEYLRSGDYSYTYDKKDYQDSFLVERKSGKVKNGGGYAEIRGNLFTGHKRFKAEFNRMELVNDVHLILENADVDSWRDVTNRKGMVVSNSRFKVTFETFFKYRNYERSKKGTNPIEIHYVDTDRFGYLLLKLIGDNIKANINH